MDKYKNPAIVIGGGVTGLGIIRNLGRNGVDVYCVVERKDEAICSKYCKEYFVFPGVETSLEQLKTFLIKFAHRLTCGAVLFPTSDISVLNIARLIREMNDYVAPLPNQEVLETLVKKRKFYHSLKTKKVPHPVTLFLDIENLQTGKEISFPVFVKPSVSQIFARKFGKKGFVANSEEELHRYFLLMEKCEIDAMVQEIVPGPPTNHYFIDGYLNKNSEPVALFARRRLRMWPLSFGNSTVCVSVPISEVADMKETIVKYLASLGFRGIFSAEFKRDSRNNVGKLLEVNARSWWYNSFPSACGVNIILTAYLEAIGTEVRLINDYKTGIYLIYVTEDLKCSSAMFAQRKLSFREWLSPMTAKKDFAILASDDLRPFIMNILRTAANIIKHRKTSARALFK